MEITWPSGTSTLSNGRIVTCRPRWTRSACASATGRPTKSKAETLINWTTGALLDVGALVDASVCVEDNGWTGGGPVAADVVVPDDVPTAAGLSLQWATYSSRPTVPPPRTRTASRAAPGSS